MAPRSPGVIEHSGRSGPHRGIHGQAAAVVPLHHFLSLVFVRYFRPREGLQAAVAHSVPSRLRTGPIEYLSGDEASTALPSSLPPASYQSR